MWSLVELWSSTSGVTRFSPSVRIHTEHNRPMKTKPSSSYSAAWRRIRPLRPPTSSRVKFVLTSQTPYVGLMEKTALINIWRSTVGNSGLCLCLVTGSALPSRHPAGSESPGHPQQEHATGQSRHRPGPAGDSGHRCQRLRGWVTSNLKLSFHFCLNVYQLF